MGLCSYDLQDNQQHMGMESTKNSLEVAAMFCPQVHRFSENSRRLAIAPSNLASLCLEHPNKLKDTRLI
jgi:hypothetical protein